MIYLRAAAIRPTCQYASERPGFHSYADLIPGMRSQLQRLIMARLLTYIIHHSGMYFGKNNWNIRGINSGEKYITQHSIKPTILSNDTIPISFSMLLFTYKYM